MKYLKTYKLFESVQSYSWRYEGTVEGYQEGANIGYSFSDDYGNDYIVEFTKKGPVSNEVELKYFVIEDGHKNMSKIVNANPFRTLETILGEILIDYINRNDWIEMIHIQGLGKDVEKELETQRTRFYVRYLKNNPIPGFELYHGGNDIELVKYDE